MTNPLHSPPQRGRGLHRTGILAGLIGLCGCAGAHVTSVQEFTALQRPNLILVETSLPDSAAMLGPDARGAARALQDDLVKDLVKARILAANATGSGGPAGTVSSGVVLDVHVVSADPGDLAERLALGFGLGRSSLVVRVRLTDARRSPSATLLAFDVASDSGRGPGLILPAGVAVGTADAVGFAVGGGTGLLFNVRNGPGQDAAHTAAAITTRVGAYLARVGWLAQG